MGVRSKVLVTVLLVGAVVGAIALQTQNPNLFKGQLELQNPEDTATTETSAPESDVLADLSGSLVVIPPASADADLVVDVTIENLGPGAVSGDNPFSYAIFLNDVEVFTNSDSYTSMEAGDAINFQYPISRQIYQYPATGTVRLVIDAQGAVREDNRANNEVEVEY